MIKGTFHNERRICLVDIYSAALEVMKPGDIAHYGMDLYLRKNEAAIYLVNQFEQGASVREVEDQVDGDIWLMIWYAYPGY